MPRSFDDVVSFRSRRYENITVLIYFKSFFLII